MFYAVFRLQQLDRWLSYLYLLCFVSHRYHRLHDHLLTAFMHGVAQFRDAAKMAAQEQVAALRRERTNDLVQAGHILKLFTSEPPNATVSFQAVQAHAFALLDRDRLTQVAAYLVTHATEDETALQWAQLARMALRFKRQLRPLLLAVDIAATRRDSPLMESVAFLRQAFTADRPLRQSATAPFPSRCIPVRLKRYVYTEDAAGEKRLIPDRYECSRLITNCIISYNATILSRVLAQKTTVGDTIGIAQLTHVSPVAWQHINFYGRYEFTTGSAPIDVDKIVAMVAQRPIGESEDGV